MRIAVAYEDSKVFQHFGQTPCFMMCDVLDGRVTGTDMIPTGEVSHAALVDFLREHGANTLICGGMGEKAFRLLEAAGIQVYGGVSGDAAKAVDDLLNDRLVYDPFVFVGHKCGCH